MLHLYGRYCNASKFAGEVDLFEALDAVKRQYPIDENRIVVRGFSMGGAAAWHIAAHYAGLWAAVAPGAGFAESAQFLKAETDGRRRAALVGAEAVPPVRRHRLRRQLLQHFRWWSINGEIDPQQQAADVMAAGHGGGRHAPRRIEGPQTAHRYHPDAKIEISRDRSTRIAERGRDPYPRKVRFTTWTLAYNRMKWVTLDALGTPLGAGAPRRGDHGRFGGRACSTANVTAFTLEMGPGGCPLDLAAQARRDDRRPEGDRACADVRPLVDGALSRVRRTNGPSVDIGRSARPA